MTRAALSQTWQSGSYDTHARFVSDLAEGVIEWLAPAPGEHVLDLGCGDGVLTAALAARGCDVVGVDTSDELLSAARSRGLTVQWMDGEDLHFAAEFDAVFSNAALHWMTRPRAVTQGVRRALKPSGRFVAEFGGHGNVAAIVTAMLAVANARGGRSDLANPWYFPSSAIHRRLLEEEGFSVERIGLFPRPTPLPTGMEEWLKLFRRPFFDQFGGDADAALADTVELLRPSLCDGGGNWTADYVRLRVEAHR